MLPVTVLFIILLSILFAELLKVRVLLELIVFVEKVGFIPLIAMFSLNVLFDTVAEAPLKSDVFEIVPLLLKITLVPSESIVFEIVLLSKSFALPFSVMVPAKILV